MLVHGHVSNYCRYLIIVLTGILPLASPRRLCFRQHLFVCLFAC